MQMQNTNAPKEEYEVVDNYGEIIKAAREFIGIPAKVLAERINEKLSTMVRVEKGEMLPEDRLVKKLEKALGIKLIAKSSIDAKTYSQQRPNSLTLGDAAKMDEDKKE